VGDSNSELGTDQCGGYGGIDVAVNQGEIGLALGYNRLKRGEDGGGLLRMAAGADFQIAIGLGHFEFLEENVGHDAVVVLAGVHQSLANSRPGCEGAEHWSRFHEVGTGADDVENVHGKSSSQGEEGL
jgi:hypothetical protein